LASRLELRFEGLREDPPIRDRYDLLLRIEARLVVEADGVVILDEPHLPVVELASQLSQWISGGAATDFNYESMDAEDVILWFRNSAGAWSVGSDWNTAAVKGGFERGDLIYAASQYIQAVPIRVQQELRRDVSRLIRQRFKVADDERTNLARQIDEFLAAIVPSEVRPYLITDQATVFDVTTLDADEIAARCLREYGIRPSTGELALPLWQLVARLRAKNTRN